MQFFDTPSSLILLLVALALQAQANPVPDVSDACRDCMTPPTESWDVCAGTTSRAKGGSPALASIR